MYVFVLFFSYVYDWGDDWQHVITLEKLVRRYGSTFFGFFKCLGGSGATPPEDCGCTIIIIE